MGPNLIHRLSSSLQNGLPRATAASVFSLGFTALATNELHGHPVYMNAHCGSTVGLEQHQSTRTNAQSLMEKLSHQPGSAPGPVVMSKMLSPQVSGPLAVLLSPEMVTVTGLAPMPG